MVQRKVPNKLGIKPYSHKTDTEVANLRPLSPKSNDLKKIMKKSRPIKRLDESRSSSPPFKKKTTQPVHEDGARSTPNYMKSTSSFEARKEQSPIKTRSPKVSRNLKTDEVASGNKGSRTSSLKMVRSLTKTTSFKLLRPLKKVILCEDLDAQRATCSSTLKESKFPNYLQLSPGGTELEGTSAMKVCPYTYCSLNGHHHAPLQPLKCFLSAKRRALKTQKSFKLGCLSPRQTKLVSKNNDIKGSQEVDMKEDNRDFFIKIYRKDEEGKGSQDLECLDIDWEEGYCSAPCKDDEGDICEKKIQKTGDHMLCTERQESYDEESVSSGAWSEEDGDSESDGSYQQIKVDQQSKSQDFQNYENVSSGARSEEDGDSEFDGSCQQMKVDQQSKNQDFQNYDKFKVPSTTTKADVDNKLDEFQGLNLPIGDQNIKYTIKTSQESKSVPNYAEKSEDGDKNHTTIIYNIIQFNISVYINGEKTGHSETDKGVTVQVPVSSTVADKMKREEVNEAMEEQGTSKENNDNNLTAFDESREVNHMVTDEKLPFNRQDIVSMDFVSGSVTEISEGSETKPVEEQTDSANEIASETDIKTTSLRIKNNSSEDLEDPTINLRGFTRGKRSDQDTDDDSNEYNQREPNFLPEESDPDAEVVDLKHQSIDERKNAEEWMVDFALQQVVTTLAPARKKKVALLVEAFEKVLPTPNYERRPTSKAFTNGRPVQACS